MASDESLNLDILIDEPHQLAEEITNKYVEWRSAKMEATTRWKEVISYVYATSTRETSNSSTGGLEGEGGWHHSTTLPKLTQLYDNLIANYRFALFPNEDWFEFKGTSQDSVLQEKRVLAENFLKTKHRTNNFETVVLQLLDDWVLYGNCFAEVTYEIKSSIDKDGNVVIDTETPVVNRRSPHDIVFLPTASSFEAAPKITRDVQSLGEFLRDIDENPTLNYDPKVVEQMKEFRRGAQGDTDGTIDKSIQMQLDGFGSYSTYLSSGQVEVLKFYGDIYDIFNDKLLKNHEITVVDRRWVLSSGTIKTWDGKAKIYHSGWRPRPDNLWGQGPLDNLVGLQYKMNHLENARADAMDQMVTPTRVITGDVDEEGVTPGVPGGIYRITSGEGSVTNLVPDTTILNADLQINNIITIMEEMVGAPREALGFKTPGEQTATEFSGLANAASRNFQNRIERFESTFLEKILNAELEYGRQFLSGTTSVQGTGSSLGETTFADITAEDLNISGNIVARGARHFARQNQLLQNIVQLQQLASTDPMVVQHFPSKKLARMYEDLLGIEEFGLFEAFGRVAEEQELAQLQQVAGQQLQQEGAAVDAKQTAQEQVSL